MRSLSNLIKYNYVYLNQQDKKEIDSNSLIAKLIPQVKPKIIGGGNGEFVPGIIAPELDIRESEEELEEEESEVVKEKASEIIRLAKEEAENIIKTAKEKAIRNSEDIKVEAKNLGYSDGYEKGMKEAKTVEMVFRNQKKENQRQFEEQIRLLEPEFVDIMISLIGKITGVLVEDNKDIIVHLVHSALTNSDASKEFLIHVSSDDFKVLNANKESLYKVVREGADIEIVEDFSLSKNECMIEMDSKVIDCSLDIQLKKLKMDLKLLSNI